MDGSQVKVGDYNGVGLFQVSKATEDTNICKCLQMTSHARIS